MPMERISKYAYYVSHVLPKYSEKVIVAGIHQAEGNVTVVKKDVKRGEAEHLSCPPTDPSLMLVSGMWIIGKA
eukprot:3719485-Pleurochrysis_carterae.AAC.1